MIHLSCTLLWCYWQKYTTRNMQVCMYFNLRCYPFLNFHNKACLSSINPGINLTQDLLTSQAPQVDTTSTITYNTHHRTCCMHFDKSLFYFPVRKIMLYEFWANWTNTIFNSEKLYTLSSDLHHPDRLRSKVEVIHKWTQQGNRDTECLYMENYMFVILINKTKAGFPLARKISLSKFFAQFLLNCE